MKPILIIRNMIERDRTNIPYFINGTNAKHKEIWRQIDFVLRTIARLTTETIMEKSSPGKIELMVQMVDNSIVMMVDLSKGDIDIELSNYILECLESYINKSIEFECFEVTENLTQFKKLYLVV